MDPETVHAVTISTRPNVFEWSVSGADEPTTLEIPYDEITGVTYATKSVIRKKLKAEHERTYAMPTKVVDGLFRAVSMLNLGVDMNCHRFSRIITDIHSKPRGNYDFVPWDPLVADCDMLEKSPQLAMGSVGVVDILEAGIAHSLVGLGEDDADCIHVLSSRGELGFSNYGDVMDFYEKLWNGYTVELYRVTE